MSYVLETFHFTDEEVYTERYGNLPKFTQLVRGRGFEPREANYKTTGYS